MKRNVLLEGKFEEIMVRKSVALVLTGDKSLKARGPYSALEPEIKKDYASGKVSKVDILSTIRLLEDIIDTLEDTIGGQ